MTHYTSTLATTACAAFGLLAAAHILHPGNYETQTRPARPAIVATAAPVAWVDPPARVADATTTGAIASAARLPGAPEPDRSGLLVPQMAAALPPGAAMIQPLPSEMTAPAERVARVETAPRSKVARRTARARHATVTRTAQADRPAVAPEAVPAPAPQATGRIDPIGDLMRGLGLGRDS